MNIDFDKMQGLVPAIVQDAANGDILMLGFMNQEAWDKTAAGGYVTFYSRTRNKLWTKGETSGNRLKVVSASTDCDFDSLLIKVEVEGEGVVCHEGTRSCFTKELEVLADHPSKTAKEPAPLTSSGQAVSDRSESKGGAPSLQEQAR